ncbi:YqhG family protein [Hydrogenibacillus schlegelii]|uniref:Uncharacterized protein n=3 Tax=Hydrogenibacillus schlegelii TaxID=1484 RepID=A0A179INM3_HYDSH|nr:YqhG family protein [Hydrogenibacillus schlegelii]OAR03833.1 hypothetical protein SA87_03035 [Hydrogenibacillus schlegelii]
MADDAALYAFARRFFEARRSVIREAGDAHLVVELSREADEALRYRPFYWSYVTSLGLSPTPLVRTYRFPGLRPTATPPALSMHEEVLTFGAPRLRRMLEAAVAFGRLSRAFEVPEEENRPPEAGSGAVPGGAHSPRGVLVPWLLLSFTVAYTAALRWERLVTYGVRLTDLALDEAFHARLAGRRLGPNPPPDRPILTPLFRFSAAVEKATAHLRARLQAEDRSWADAWIREGEAEKAKIARYYDALLRRSGDGAAPRRRRNRREGPARGSAPEPSARDERAARNGEPPEGPSGTVPKTPGATSRGQGADDPLAFRTALSEEKKRRLAEIDWAHTPAIDVTLEQAALLYLLDDGTRPAPAGGPPADEA